MTLWPRVHTEEVGRAAVTPITDTNEHGRRRTWRDARSAPYQASADAGQLGWALQARGHLVADQMWTRHRVA